MAHPLWPPSWALANLAAMDEGESVDVGDSPGPLARLPSDGDAGCWARPRSATSVACPTDYARSNIQPGRFSAVALTAKARHLLLLPGGINLPPPTRLQRLSHSVLVKHIFRDHPSSGADESCPAFNHVAAQANHQGNRAPGQRAVSMSAIRISVDLLIQPPVQCARHQRDTSRRQSPVL